MTALCEWTELPVEACSHCTPEPPKPAEGTQVTATTAVAGTCARCPVCEEWIWQGDPIRLEHGLWHCGGCAL